MSYSQSNRMGVQSSEFKYLCPAIKVEAFIVSCNKSNHVTSRHKYLFPAIKVEAFIVSCNNDLIRPKSNHATHSHCFQAEFTFVILAGSAEFCVDMEIV